MTTDEVIAALDALQDIDDPESQHGDADDLLLKYVPEPVRDAYNRVVKRTGSWWYA
jgi:hypothetical protein